MLSKNHQNDEIFHSFISNEEIQDWETWHRRYGHIGYSGLQKLIDLKMVDGLTVNNDSIKPDCVMCTQAKQLVKPFDGNPNRNSKSIFGENMILLLSIKINIISYSSMMRRDMSQLIS